MLTGDNSILKRATDAKTNTEKAQIVENARLDILAEITNKKGTDLTADEIKDVLGTYFTSDTIPEDLADLTQEMTTKSGEYTVKLSEVLNGVTILTPPSVETVSTSTSYVGYYADFEADGTIDGVIYADMAKGNTGDGQFNDSNGNYTIPVESGFKGYYVSKIGHNATFGTKDVLSPIGTGKDRFYVMALENMDGQFTWYNSAVSQMSDYATTTSGDFGTGKTNTQTMITKWNDKKYGGQNTNDVWGVIQTQFEDGWFVPSSAEWSAFAEELEITPSNCQTLFGLQAFYWSSSQCDQNKAWSAALGIGRMTNFANVNTSYFVRLSATF